MTVRPYGARGEHHADQRRTVTNRMALLVRWSSCPETINGLPLHPLVVHAAVVLIPLSGALALLMVVLPASASDSDRWWSCWHGELSGCTGGQRDRRDPSELVNKTAVAHRSGMSKHFALAKPSILLYDPSRREPPDIDAGRPGDRWWWWPRRAGPIGPATRARSSSGGNEGSALVAHRRNRRRNEPVRPSRPLAR